MLKLAQCAVRFDVDMNVFRGRYLYDIRYNNAKQCKLHLGYVHTNTFLVPNIPQSLKTFYSGGGKTEAFGNHVANTNIRFLIGLIDVSLADSLNSYAVTLFWN